MRIFAFILCLFPLLLSAQDMAIKIDELLSAYYRNDLFSGTVLVAKEGKIIFKKGYGEAGRENHLPNTETTEYRIGSVTKPFTAVLFMKLFEEGLISPGDPLSKFLPGYPNSDIIKLQHLLSHTSGIKNITSLKQYYAEWINQPASLATTISRFQNEPLSFTPGEKFEYSNSNYILLSYVLEKATGSSFEDCLTKYILHPLKMHNTGLDQNQRDSKHKAFGYQASPENDFAPARFNDMSIMMGAGSMYSTVGDLFNFDRALSNDIFLSAASKKQLYGIHQGNYAFGWEIDTINGRLQISHSGSIDGFLSNFIRYPDQDVCIIFLSNYFNSKGQQISKALSSIVFNEAYNLPRQRKFVQLTGAQLSIYEGRYIMDKGPFIEIYAENGQLKGRLGQQSPFKIWAEDNGTFYIKSIDTEVEFIRDTDDKVTELQLKQGSKLMSFKKAGSP